ncbi:hypothetical protein PPACK8108_LOCUS3153 [Phakopsora pachyrhizi]|uniref:Uncharacterized protein n=1 Tax=Phakopsora pachyrhizi TaxID=170000 RepID=A0AAV0AKK6_PHAPC|nr:hypothetical protein PPACK8108_LOCUS3153 [Phakopsora pachyrhizi]
MLKLHRQDEPVDQENYPGWHYQLSFINHFETIHTGPFVSLISHGGLSVGLSLMDSS